MPNYKDDRNFTDYVHETLAIPKIYEKLHWEVQDVESSKLEYIDINLGIDYVLKNQDGEKINVQERFRDSYYKIYDDATLRFRRDRNTHPERIKSEFYKIKADYLVYGITNGKKFLDKRNTLTDFIKWVIVDINLLKSKYENDELEIDTSSGNCCRI